MILRTVVIAVAALLAALSVAAVASEQAEVRLTAQRWAEAFRSGHFETTNAPCDDDAVVIDDLPPHLWQGPGACSRWYKAFAAWAATAAVTDADITLGATSHLEINSGYAYLVAPVTLSFLKAGKPVRDTGVLTMSLRRVDSGWRISGFAWADQ
ncbi:MAG: nuclear transport factor 2 family protein [Gammaproteobacteria bacterium]|nr:nuclear transport factor 2 family protein [Gammaproteobacteria bacterium]